MAVAIAIENLSVERVHWGLEQQNEISAIYEMLKAQEHAIFDLSYYETWGTNIMDYVENSIKHDIIYVVKHNNDVCGFFMLESPRYFGDIISRVDVHMAIKKSYWGKTSREIVRYFKDFLDTNYRIKKYVATVPQCGYGVIKLLKDIGFKHEGTLKHSVIFRDKHGIPKYYDELIYSSTREDI